jgi:hypothetical protein
MFKVSLSKIKAKKIINRNLNSHYWTDQNEPPHIWGTFDNFLDKPESLIGIRFFGKVPNKYIGIEINNIFSHKQKLETEKGARYIKESNPSDDKTILSDDEYINSIEEFSLKVGGIQHQLRMSLYEDIELANNISGNVVLCFWHSLISRRLSPYKYYPICGSTSRGYGSFIFFLSHIPLEENLKSRITKNLNLSSWDQYMEGIWKSRAQLMELEKEYRNISIAIAQIGIGIGGMMLGVISLIISLILIF